MSNFTKKRRLAYVRLREEITHHLHAIFNQQIETARNQLMDYLTDDLYKYIKFLDFEMDFQFSCICGNAFKFGMDYPNHELNRLVTDFYTLPPDIEIEKNVSRMQKVVNLLSQEIEPTGRDLLTQYLDLLKQTYTIKPYLALILETGQKVKKGIDPTEKKRSDQIRPPFSLRQFCCLFLAAQGKKPARIAGLLDLTYNQVVSALDRGICKPRMAAGAMREYEQAAMINRLALICNMTERDMASCIEHIVCAAGILPQMSQYINDFSVDKSLNLLYHYCKYGKTAKKERY